MRTRFHTGRSALLVLGVSIATTMFGLSAGWAQEKRAWSNKEYAQYAIIKYTQQHAIDVGDLPGHQIRLVEIQTTYPPDKPAATLDGVRLREGWTRATSDLIDGNGRTGGYTVDVYENGDKVFSEYGGEVQAVVKDGVRKISVHSVGRTVGGTGKFRGIKGLSRTTCATAQLGTSFQCESEGEYWFE